MGFRFRKSFVVVVVLVLLFSFSCASAPMANQSDDAEARRFVAPPNGSALYVSRPGSLGFGVTWDIFVDGNLIATLPVRTFIMTTVPAGRHVITSAARIEGGKTLRLTLEASPGQIRFLEITNSGELLELNTEQGKKSIARGALVASSR